jgi:hypothetical protein
MGMQNLWWKHRTILDYRGHWLEIFILFVGFTDPGTFIGPPWLERETRIRESPVRVPTVTTAGPRE